MRLNCFYDTRVDCLHGKLVWHIVPQFCGLGESEVNYSGRVILQLWAWPTSIIPFGSCGLLHSLNWEPERQ